MPWRANVVYAAPTDSVIDAFRRLGLGDALFVVRDLEGIRFSWSREQFFGDSPGEIRHDLPERGLLAVMPPIIRTSYDKEFVASRASRAQFDDGYGDDPATKWENAGLRGRDRVNGLEWPTGLHRTMTEIARATGETVVHYFCETSGGPPDVEVAFIASPEIAVVDREPLVVALAALGLELPTGYFALHETSFDWSRYVLR